MTPLIHLVEGTIFAGEFRVLRPLGDGAMGAVYVVEQWRTGRLRALKIMRPDLVHDAGLRARFLREATVSGRIRSEHVVHVVDAGIDAATGMPWIAMELLEGGDLADVLEQRGPLPHAEVREIFAQLCHAVDAAHDAGVIHRDLKPQNVFAARSQREGAPLTVKVLDFGIAKLVADAVVDPGGARLSGNRGSGRIGTPSWMAPEQADLHAEISPATDVWALGLLAFALLTARAFFRPAARGEGGLTAFDPIPRASERAAVLGVGEHLPPGFDAWFARCLAIDPRARWPRARDAREAFDALFEAGARASQRARTPSLRPGSLSIPSSRGRTPSPRPDAREDLTEPRPLAFPRRILLVDDSLSDQLLIGHHLSHAGFEVIAAASGEEALARVAAGVPALILLDFLLPDIDAPEVIRRLRALDAMRETPVILLTATDLASHIAEGFQAGARDYLMKPVDRGQLVSRVEAALAAAEAARRARVMDRMEARHDRLLADLEEARAEQELPLAALPAAWEGFRAIGGVAQSGVVGGDLLAVYEGAGGARTLAAIDVSGHGAAAALVAASARAALGLLLRSRPPADALAALNDELCAEAAPRHVCVALVQVRGNEVTVVNAGMPPVVVARAGLGTQAIVGSGVPPGLFPEQAYTSDTIELLPGDRVVVVSDGLIEPFGLADDPTPVLESLGAFDAGRWTGRERPPEVAERLRDQLAEVAQPDDATFLLLEALEDVCTVS